MFWLFPELYFCLSGLLQRLFREKPEQITSLKFTLGIIEFISSSTAHAVYNQAYVAQTSEFNPPLSSQRAYTVCTEGGVAKTLKFNPSLSPPSPAHAVCAKGIVEQKSGLAI